MTYVAAVTLLLILEYFVFMMLAGMQRSKAGISAPAMTGSEAFERASRVHLNTLEQLAFTLPAMWLSATYFIPAVAAGLGLVFFIGRMVYRQAYVSDPSTRGTGMMIGFLANVGLLLTCIWGVGKALFIG